MSRRTLLVGTLVAAGLLGGLLYGANAGTDSSEDPDVLPTPTPEPTSSATTSTPEPTTTVTVPSRPNIIYIMADDLGLGDLPSFSPQSPIRTPNLDRLARGGMRLTRFRSGAPICSPTRVAVLSGQTPERLGVRTILTPSSTGGLRGDEASLPAIFNAVGYDTTHIGKWHSGEVTVDDELGPIAVGFDTAIQTDEFYDDFTLTVDQPGATVEEDYTTDGAQPGHHTTEVFTDKAIDAIDASATNGNPFFVNLWYNAPHVAPAHRSGPFHVPLSSPPHADTASAADHYVELVRTLDRQVGRILDVLDTHDLTNDTLVVFTSDNGAIYSPEGDDGYGLTWSNAGLNGSKNTHYEGGLRVPFIVRWPGVIRPESTSNVFATSTDLLPTLVDIIGGNTPAGATGQSLLSVFTAGTVADPVNRTLMWEGSALRPRFDVDQRSPYDYAVIRDDRWKLMSRPFVSPREYLLYDLDSDPLEETDLADDPEHQQIANELAAEYQRWSSENSRAKLTIGGAEITDDWQMGFGADHTEPIIVDPHPSLDFGNADFTLSVDVEPSPNSPVGDATIVSHPGSFTIELTLDGRIRIVVLDTAGRSTTMESSQPIPTAEPSRIAFTAKGWVHGTDDERRLEGRLYIRGEREALAPLAPPEGAVARSGLGLEIGGPGTDSPFMGTISGLRVHNRTLTGDEITDLP